MVENVRDSLRKGKERWGDPEYLARVVFCGMIDKGDLDDITGYGIGFSEHGDVWRIVEVNCKKQEVIVKDNGETTIALTFERFIEAG